MNCAFCKAPIEINGTVGRRDTCPNCNRDLRCCKQCEFYDPSAYNECREVNAERIVDKERANFCDYFVFRGSKVPGGVASSRVRDAKKALEALFQKK
ncbi:MAG: hypothetical protein JRI79_08740 [Deltaproteobacteria bacterium]|nr:hypothetical protein [Deltaproteobacteria bacterium]MBW1921755.1 hypothetical protein [Deltaproteobacteria bacterium]MBW1936744.1 hypothetical protein [Deltaproteobacteria bacterium]MBW1978035.1 hypothetical protein [Deltaproteobacteria bacterium]MBW2045321.1 hypothetical protein [Deltaproteobacteria bacterium]